jgi:hypothetical protein
MMINVNRAMNYVKEIKLFGGQALLVAAVTDALKKHWAWLDNKNLPAINERERLLCALAYSEFLAEETTDGAYWQAELARQGYMAALGYPTDDARYEFVKEVERCL